MRLAGLILAAGASRRMGSPKPLLRFEGQTFLDRLIAAFEPVCDPVVVVLGFDEARIRAGIQRGDAVQFARNPHPERGMLSSLQCGLRALPGDVAGVAFTPADYPLIRPSSVRQLAGVFAEPDRDRLLLVPTCDGRRGHPVCVDRALFDEFLALPVESEPRAVVHRHRDQTEYIEVGDPGILSDVDDPAAFNKLTNPD